MATEDSGLHKVSLGDKLKPIKQYSTQNSSLPSNNIDKIVIQENSKENISGRCVHNSGIGGVEMKLLTVGKDISELIEQIKWSGDTKQVARTIQFTIAKNKKDKDFPTVVIDEGAEIIMQDDSGKDVFGGIIFDIDKSASSKVETYLAYDLMFYINNSDVNKIFKGTPETIVPGICTELGIESGTMAATGVNISSMPCFGKKAYEAIMMAYTAAAKQNGIGDQY